MHLVANNLYKDTKRKLIKLGRERERIVEDYGALADVLELGTSELFDLEDSRPSFCKPQSVTTQKNGEIHGLVFSFRR